tara:strand:- start:11167 stop:11916 length:750 start_codon:yes stop_codon:yes gene_type:complete
MVKPKTIPDISSAEAALYNKFHIQLQHLPSEKSVYFKAMVTQFEDQYTSDWALEHVFGRMDPVRTFRGTQRIITLGWDVVAGSLEEARHNLAECSTLLSMLYPSYEGGAPNVADATAPEPGTPTQEANEAATTEPQQGPTTTGGNAATIKSAPLFRIKFANLIQDTKNPTPTLAINDGLIGSIDGLTYAPDVEQGFFDPKDEKGVLYPQTIKLSFGFYVAHDHPLGWSSENKGALRSGTVFPYPKKGGS